MARIRSFSGAALARIRFPVGGIGTGCVSVSGRGALEDFEWWNHPGKRYRLPYTFFAVTARERGHRGRVRARVLAVAPTPPYDGVGFGVPREQGQGLPHFARARFRGEYPLATVALDDPDFPLEAELEAWNPLVPLDADASGLPLAVLRYRLRNRSNRAVEATTVGTLFNAVGLDGNAVPIRRHHGDLGGNRNRLVHGPARLVGLHMTRDAPESGSVAEGSLFLGILEAERPGVLARWPRGAWFDDLQRFWDGLLESGRLPDTLDDTPSPPGVSDPGSIAETTDIPAGASRDVTFLMTWHFPTFRNDWNPDEPQVAGRELKTWYATRFHSAFGVASHAAVALPDLERETRAFHSAFFGQSLPPEVLDAASSQMSTLRTPICIRLDDGSFHGFEGGFDRRGCCPMDCTHVWNYAQALPHLWPRLERSLRDTGLRANLFEDGRQAFRTLLPVESGARFDRKPAADGQMGELIKLYRDWRVSGDTDWMRELWPAAKSALDYAQVQWDADGDGAMEGEQHVTYDIELYGANPLTGTLYLAALAAGAALAEAAGDSDAAERYRELGARGADALEERCWNGAWYVQCVPTPDDIRSDPHLAGSLGASLDGVEPGEPPRYQVGEGCLSDQLLGEWMARAAGLGRVLPRARTLRALRSIAKHNFRKELREHPNAQRIYALGDEPGLLLCSWPRGGRPALPFPYADEVWTGIEYQVAAHLIWEGLVDEGLDLVRAARGRYDGVRRNPWDEIECGHHYARAMSSWTLLHALSGFEWDGVTGRLGFAPRVQAGRFRGLFTAGSAWGAFQQRATAKGLTASLDVLGGTLRLRRLDLVWPGRRAPGRLKLREGPPGARLSARRGQVGVELSGLPPLASGESLRVRIAPTST